jgi:hypothetical protein
MQSAAGYKTVLKLKVFKNVTVHILFLPGYATVLLMTRRSVLILSPTSKMRSKFFSETSLNIYQSTRNHISDDSNLHNDHCENFKISDQENIVSSGMTPLSLVESNVSEESTASLLLP